MRDLKAFACLVPALTLAMPAGADIRQAGVLRPHPANPGWLTDDSGRGIFLAGSHTWATVQERGIEGTTPDFDFPGYLDFMQRHGHNFLRLWAWEHATWMQFAPSTDRVRYKPLPYTRTGPGTAVDGGPKFDVSRLDEAYFERLRRRVVESGRRGIYVSVMFFQGFSTEQKGAKVLDPKLGNPWLGHPFHRDNNINGIDGDPDGDGRGLEVHTLASPAILRLQEAYVRKVIATLRGLDHVLWEIGNECHTSSIEWQYHLIRFIQENDAAGSRRRLVGITGSPIPNPAMRASPADWFSPFRENYLDDPPVPATKVVIVDTDHLKPFGTEPLWAWKNFLRGNHFITMDAYRDVRFSSPPEPVPEWDAIRRAMGDAVQLSQRVDLGSLAPMPDLASTRFCLAEPGRQYLVLQPDRGRFEVQLPDAKSAYGVEWLEVATGRRLPAPRHSGSGRTRFEPPVDGPAVLHLHAE